jgi:branched-chain amino acid transport system substrate-binding protein
MKVLTKIALLTTVLFGGTAEAQISDGVIKIGVLGDMSSIYADLGGPGSVVAARIENIDPTANWRRIEIISADHHNKADVGLSIARTWIDVDKVDVIVDVPNSAIALGVSTIVREKKEQH